MAGTVPGAIIAVTEDAGKIAQETEKKIEVAFERRSKDFVALERQQRLEKILNAIQDLSDAAVFSLNNTPPVSDPEVDKLVKLRDPQNRRFTDPKVAREILKMRVVMRQRSDEALDAWEAAIKAAP